MMTTLRCEIRRGAYYDSVTLMQLQKALLDLPGVRDAGVVMGTPANQEILRESGLLPPEAQSARPEDLVIVVGAEEESAAVGALAQVEGLLARRRTNLSSDFHPHSVETAARQMPDAQWLLVSVPGHYAAAVAREGLQLGKHVFLFSDNVSLADEISLKQSAREQGLLLMGPDCGTALIGGAGLGFANRVNRGGIGIVSASGTGLQAVAARAHRLGAGIRHAIGTGGRDLSDEVGGAGALGALEALGADTGTRVIALVSKPPSSAVAARVLAAARHSGKPVVVDFIGYTPPAPREGNLHFAPTLDETARLAVALDAEAAQFEPPDLAGFAPAQRYLRGLYSGGTLAYEAQLLLRDALGAVHSNAPLDHTLRLASALHSQEHSVLDLGGDEFTVGRLHPMMDNDLRIRRLRQEAADPAVAVIVLDVVLGYGAHADPASELAPAIAEARARAEAGGRRLEIIAVMVGTDDDPQSLARQSERLREAGALVFEEHALALRHAGSLARALETRGEKRYNLDAPFAALNVGLELFADSLRMQGFPVVHIDWQPPAGGNEKLMAILARMKKAA